MRDHQARVVARSLLLVLAAVAATGACTSTNGARPATATLSSAPAVGPQPPRSLKERMQGHSAYGNAARDAVARADLEVARAAAKKLAELRPEAGLAPALSKDLDAMNVAAARVVKADNVREASRRLAELASTCGDCHATLGGPSSVVTEPPHDDLDATVPRMRRHEWAVARMWTGLIDPSDLAWRAGARVLADAPLEPEQLTPGTTPAPEISVLATTVHELAASAAATKATVDRTATYGEILATCASCHQRLGGGPDGGAPALMPSP